MGTIVANTAILTDDTATIISDEPRHFHWGAVIAGAIASIATFFFLVTLGSGVGLVVATTANNTGAVAFLTLGAIYLFAAQAFGFAVGAYLVGRLIGPEVETSKEEEFRAAAHGFTMWGLAVVAGLLIAGFTSALPHPSSAALTPSEYWQDELFRPASNTPLVTADKAEVGRIWVINARNAENPSDTGLVARLVSQDTGLSTSEALTRVEAVQAAMRDDLTQKAKTAAYIALWSAFALLFGAVVSVAAAISSRWMDDKISFSLAPRTR
jgi:hypothetical protein